MNRIRKLTAFCLIFAIILLSSSICSAHAQNSTDSNPITQTPASNEKGQVPTPDIHSNSPSGSRTGDGITVSIGDCDSNWYALKGDGSSGNNLEGLYSNIQTDYNGSKLCFETQLTSSQDGGIGNFGYYGNNPYAIYINCSGEIIPINLYNCTYFDESRTDTSYVGDLPTFNNTFTFHDISLETYGNAPSTVTITLTQQFIENWTEMTIKMDTDFNFTNMQLYSPSTQLPISPGTPFSLTIIYDTDMSNLTAQQEVGHSVNFQPSVTSTQIYYTDDDGFGYQFNLANMNFGDSFIEVQGNNQINDLTPDVHFEPIMQGAQGTGADFVLCYQTFNGLTYGVTTGLNSDPTIRISHDPLQPANWILNIVIISAVVASVALLCVALLFRRKRNRLMVNLQQ